MFSPPASTKRPPSAAWRWMTDDLGESLDFTLLLLKVYDGSVMTQLNCRVATIYYNVLSCHPS